MKIKFKIKKPLAYNFPPPPLYRLNQWMEKSCKDTRAEKIYCLLYERFFQEVRKEKQAIVRPELENGKYKFQELIEYKKSLSLPKFRAKMLKVFIP